jgi:hypothetical protein
LKRHHARFRGQRGQILALVAIAIPTVLGLGGLSIDVGHWYHVSRKSQATADAAALTAARYLPYHAAEMGPPAVASAATNMPEMDQPLEVSNAYCDANDSTCDPALPKDVKVTVRTHASTFLAKIFGFTSVSVSKEAVATRAEKMVPLAIIVGNGSCGGGGGGGDEDDDEGDDEGGGGGGLSIQGDNTTINGAVISNGSIFASGNGNTADAASFHDGCTAPTDTSNFSPIPTGDPVTEPWPFDFTRSDFSCVNLPSGDEGGFDFGSTKPKKGWPSYWDGHTISPGTYCSSGKITVSADNVVANNVTLVAKSLHITGSGSTFTPNQQGVIFYADGNNGLLANEADNATWTGIIYVPNGRFSMPSDNSTINGLVEAESLKLQHDGVTFNGSGPLVAAGVVKLIK